jgi:FkbM family methyltransferase
MTSLVGRAMRAYRASPLHPHLSRPLAMVMALSHRLRRQELTKDVGRFSIALRRDQFIDAHIIHEGVWEPETTALLSSVTRPGAVCIDIGAHIGWTALTMAAEAGPTGLVVAVEPSGWSFARLTHNIAINQGRVAEIRAERAAAGAEDRRDVEMLLPDGFRLDGVDTARKYKVDIVTIDTIAQQLPKVDVIKTDTDGFEMAVLAGASETVRRHRPTVVFEFAPQLLADQGTDWRQLTAWFRSRGYDLFTEYEPAVPIDDDGLEAQLERHADFNVVALPQ